MTNLDQAFAIVRSDDRSTEAYRKLQALLDSSSAEESSKIGDLIEAFIANGGEIPIDNEDTAFNEPAKSINRNSRKSSRHKGFGVPPKHQRKGKRK